MDVGEGGLGLLAHGASVSEFHHLGQIADGGAIGHGDGAACGRLQSGQDLEHGALACTILADKGYAVAVTDDITHAREKSLGAELNEKVVN